jgi:hypothetical protein
VEEKQGLFFFLLSCLNVSSHPPLSPHTKTDADEGSDAEELAEKADADASGPQLPPLPDTALEQGILPRVIKTLVDRRAAVKKLLKVRWC